MGHLSWDKLKRKVGHLQWDREYFNAIELGRVEVSREVIGLNDLLGVKSKN